jgi:hypothetical protein
LLKAQKNLYKYLFCSPHVFCATVRLGTFGHHVES